MLLLDLRLGRETLRGLFAIDQLIGEQREGCCCCFASAHIFFTPFLRASLAFETSDKTGKSIYHFFYLRIIECMPYIIRKHAHRYLYFILHAININLALNTTFMRDSLRSVISSYNLTINQVLLYRNSFIKCAH